MKVRSKKNEIEAKFAGNKGSIFSRPSGKLERTVYTDGNERLKISIRGLRNLDGKTAHISSGLYEFASIDIINGAGRYVLESGTPGKIPDLKLHDTVDVKVEDDIVMSGILYSD